MIAAAGLLGQRKGKAMYWEWYDKAWEYALKYFIDEERVIIISESYCLYVFS